MEQGTKELTLQNVLTEKDLCELLGMNKNQVANLRIQKGLPFIKLSATSRLYFDRDIVKFFENQKTILNRDEVE
ncbi:MAG: helix-turn-helix domain-containing protein [Candidatus Celaenobacter polaris]|nr:helix-turn-helix domain-containing protein [Candidatus Celaenobacter polaris]